MGWLWSFTGQGIRAGILAVLLAYALLAQGVIGAHARGLMAGSLKADPAHYLCSPLAAPPDGGKQDKSSHAECPCATLCRQALATAIGLPASLPSVLAVLPALVERLLPPPVILPPPDPSGTPARARAPPAFSV